MKTPTEHTHTHNAFVIFTKNQGLVPKKNLTFADYLLLIFCSFLLFSFKWLAGGWQVLEVSQAGIDIYNNFFLLYTQYTI